MAITVTLVDVTQDRLVYLLANSGSPLGGTFTITSSGAATPDLRTDASEGGPMRVLGRAGVDGIGTVAATTMIQAQARNLLLGDQLSVGAGIGNDLVPRFMCKVTNRSGTSTWSIDATVAAGNPQIAITSEAVAGEAYLEVFFRHSYTF